MKSLIDKFKSIFGHIDHGIISTIHFLDAVFTGQVIQTGIASIAQGLTQYAVSEIQHAQIREYAAGEIVKVSGGLVSNNKAYALVSHLLDVVDAHGLAMLEHLFQHYRSIAAFDAVVESAAVSHAAPVPTQAPAGSAPSV